MFRLMIAVVVSMAAGAGLGTGLYKKTFSAPEQFGPFGDVALVKPDQIGEFLDEKTIKKGVPRAEVVGKKDFQFGTMFRGKPGEHDFTLRNVGDAPLELVILNSTCKCTVGSLDKSTLDPGEETKVHLKWEARTDASSFTQSATIGTTDPLMREIPFTISGNVVDDLIWSPGHWNVDQIEATKPVEVKATAYIYTTDPVYIRESGWSRTQIGDFSEHRFGEERPIDPEKESDFKNADRALDLYVTIRPGMRQGPLTETFRVRFAVGDKDKPLPECKLCEFNLGGRVVGNVSMIGGTQLDPNDEVYEYKFGDVPVGKGATAKPFLVIRGDDAKDVIASIAEVAPTEGLKAQLGKPIAREKSVLIPLEVTIPPETEIMERSGRDRNDYGYVLVKFNREDWAPFKLFISFRVVEAGRSGETR